MINLKDIINFLLFQLLINKNASLPIRLFLKLKIKF
mgnify:CR=1 FL=1